VGLTGQLPRSVCDAVLLVAAAGRGGGGRGAVFSVGVVAMCVTLRQSLLHQRWSMPLDCHGGNAWCGKDRGVNVCGGAPAGERSGALLGE
jgi:hypothetical protein